ncbi:type III secretion system, LEE associated protein [Salmonella enterica subsp. salamae]|nr:type III secretion system, LEE associated protein [Salmonella enterica subsp. salamae]
MIDIQNVERLLLRDVMRKAHISLTQVLPTLISSKLDWENLLGDMIRHELEDNHITGAIRITCNPALKLHCILQNESNNFHIIHDGNFPINKLIIENQYVRITLDPLKQIDMLLDIFKLAYLNLIEEGQECHNYQ